MAAAASKPPLVAIACQGGGSHAAFGAGVIHRLLDDIGDRFRLAALSGTSGGAVNATLVWSGLVQDGPNGAPAEAQERLREFWRDLGAREPWDAARNVWGQVILNLPFTWEVSPYDLDLGAREEMKKHLEKWVRFGELPPDDRQLNHPTLFVGATDIENGVSAAIRGDGRVVTRPRRKVDLQRQRFGVEDVLASIAIPPLYKDEERRGTAFWDGLFSINPPIYALTKSEPKPQEIWVIQINPQRSRTIPRTMQQIQDRRNELSGNVSLNKELDMIESINDLIADGLLKSEAHEPIRIRVVGLEEADPDLPFASKFDRDPAFLDRLFELGRDHAQRFYGDRSLRTNRTRAINAAPLPVH